MPKTYTAAGSATAGDVYTASAHNVIVTSVNNFIVPPLCRVRRSTDQTFGNAVNGLANFNAEDIDTDGMFSATSNVITIQTAGVYAVSGTGGVQIHPTGVRGCFIVVNPVISGSGDSATLTSGTRITGAWTNTVNAGGTNTMLSCSTLYNFAANDTVALCIYQNAGGSLTFVSTAEQMTLSLAWVGRIS